MPVSWREIFYEKDFLTYFPCFSVQGDPIPDVLWLRSAAGGNMPLDRVHILEDRSLRLENVTVEDCKKPISYFLQEVFTIIYLQLDNIRVKQKMLLVE